MIKSTGQSGLNRSLADKLVQQMLNYATKPEDDSKWKQKSLMNMIWDSLEPKVRKEQAIKITAANQGLKFYECLDLNNKVDFMSHLKQEHIEKKIWNRVAVAGDDPKQLLYQRMKVLSATNLTTQNSSVAHLRSKAIRKKEEVSRYKSELQHHQFFHLNEGNQEVADEGTKTME